jgi:hypothetical protein
MPNWEIPKTWTLSGQARTSGFVRGSSGDGRSWCCILAPCRGSGAPFFPTGISLSPCVCSRGGPVARCRFPPAGARLEPGTAVVGVEECMAELELTFPHSNEVEEPGELPGAGNFCFPLIFFPPVKGRPEHDGLWLKAKAENGRTWMGVFAFGYSSPPALSRVLSTPEAESAVRHFQGIGLHC